MMISVLHAVAGRVPGPAGMGSQAGGLPWERTTRRDRTQFSANQQLNSSEQ